MASVGACVPILIIMSLVLNAKAAFLTVKCTTEAVGQYDQPSLLNCMVHATDKDATIRVVTWRKVEVKTTLLAFHENSMTPQPGYEFAEQSWDVKNMNVSLRITNTKVADAGAYECTVMADSGEGSAVVHLKVVAKYRAPVISSNPKVITQISGGTLMCDTVGGYPQGSIHWFDENRSDWTKSATMEAHETEDGLFHLSSELPLQAGSTFSKYICVVLNASGVKEAESAYDIKPEASGLGTDETKQRTTHVVAAVVVIGSLIVGLLLAIYLHKRRSQNARRPSTAPLMDVQHEVCRCEFEDHPPTAEDVPNV